MSSEYVWLTEAGQQFLDRDYLSPGQSVHERVCHIAYKAGQYLSDPTFASKFISYMKRGWYSLSTPVWTNFGNDRGLPISCFGSYVDDSMDSILYTAAEIGMMSKHGGGTSAFLGALRHRGATIKGNAISSGPIHFAELYEAVTNVVSQGGVRRGKCAVYLPIEHEDIMEFLNIRAEGAPIQDLSFGVTVSDTFMQNMIAGDSDKRKVWAKVLEVRKNTGYPYILFVDNANRNSPYAYTGQRIVASNLCSEIMLPSNDTESFVCCLASMNALYFDEWKDTDAVETMVFFLDAVMEEFISKATDISFMSRAREFAINHRALGLGVLGWHSYLQSKLIAFVSFEAKMKNVEIFKTISQQAYAASENLVKIGFAAQTALDTNVPRRNTTLMAIAPTKSSAFILGQVSEGVEPHRANYYVKDLAKGKFTFKNPHLARVLESHQGNTEATWDSIMKNAGSVQHLSFLSQEYKDVFKTFAEISPKEIIIQAAARQHFIDQGQSLNIMIGPDVPVKDINALMIFAWEQGVKSLYYQYSVNAAQQFARNILECSSCEA